MIPENETHLWHHVPFPAHRFRATLTIAPTDPAHADPVRAAVGLGPCVAATAPSNGTQDLGNPGLPPSPAKESISTARQVAVDRIIRLAWRTPLDSPAIVASTIDS